MMHQKQCFFATDCMNILQRDDVKYIRFDNLGEENNFQQTISDGFANIQKDTQSIARNGAHGKLG